MGNMRKPSPRKKKQTDEGLEGNYVTFLRHHTNEIKELVIENGRLAVEKKDLRKQVEELEMELSETRRKVNGVRARRYFNVALTLILIFQTIIYLI